ncbi:family 43 glycosylhydrolase [Tessaracoccus palaemonis]|uniref:Family 43 glycosylhydrolase n=1 Tax=Tessaracoccus palaemonis TaxID=2829499 RepID=A0ABX8SP63_9ACTN|nr:family 43 glycosylhydrolase [Tessaracoccus palaemonis]QXT63993.1 family 43 glycosylhydrolase [Tessaracoccus palaemonis]
MRRGTTHISMLFGALLALALVVGMWVSGQGTVTGAEAQAQLPQAGDVDVHDPTMAYDAAAGLYVLADSHNGIRTAPTMDGPWTEVGEVARADWTYDVPNSTTLWAPHFRRIGDVFYYFYSQSSFGSNNSAIGLKTTRTPADPASYVDLGRPVVGSGTLAETVTAVDFNAIDPVTIQDADGAWWLIWGSFWDGIVAQQLTDDLTGVVGSPTLIASRQADSNPVEGPAILEKDGWYYLFLSWDSCCSDSDSTYKVAVGRSQSITGPYLDQSGRALTEGGGTVILDSRESVGDVTPEGLYRAPGGGDVYSEDGVDYLVYHAYLPTNTLGVRPITWTDGWPSFADEEGPWGLGDGDTVRLVSEAHLPEVGEVDRVDGPEGFGSAMQLGGRSAVGYVELPDGIVGGLDADWTVSMWVRRDVTLGNDWARLFDFGTGTDDFMFLTPAAVDTPPLGLRFDMSAGRFTQQVPDTGNSVNVSGNWSHIAVVGSGDTITLWLNGNPARTATGVELHPADLGETTRNWLGRSQFDADPYLIGTLDDVNIFSRALSADEIAQLTREPGGGSLGGGDVAWYRFDEAGGLPVADSSGSGNDATAVVLAVAGDGLQNPTPGTQCLTAGDQPTQAACQDGAADQRWTLHAADGGTWRLADAEGRCLAVADDSGTPGTAVVAAACSEDPLQTWVVEDTGHGFRRFTSTTTDLALQIESDGGQLGSAVVAAERGIAPVANQTPEQQWLPETVG